MHDIRAIRDNKDSFVAGLTRRGLANAATLADDLVTRDKDLRALQTRLQEAQARRNEASKLIGRAKAQKDDNQAEVLMVEVAGLKDEIAKGEERERTLQAELRDILANIPNLPASDVPDGADETANVELVSRRWGTAPGMNAPREHFDLGEALGLMDFERATKVSGARFVYLKGALARLERALTSFMLDLHTEHFGYTEIAPPILVREQAMFGTNQLPKFAEESFRTTTDYWLIPTAEVPLTNYVREEILDEASLPLAFHGLDAVFPRRSRCGRQGHARHDPHAPVLQGRARVDRDSGPIRGRTRAHDGLRAGSAEAVGPASSRGDFVHRRHGLRRAEDLRHRSLVARSEPFREISSCSNCGEFQARRMNARYRPKRREIDPFRAHAERFGARGRSHACRDPGELSTGRRFHRCARGVASLYGRLRADCEIDADFDH
jgi:seryl-tRNA synthetase